MFRRNLNRTLLLFVALWMMAAGFAISGQDDDSAYQIPQPDVDTEQVIAQVGDVSITLEDFLERVRYDRVFAYSFVQDFAESQGEGVLDMDNPENPTAQNLVEFLRYLTNEQVIGADAYNRLVLDWAYHHEAEARGIEVEECDLNRMWVEHLLLPPLLDCDALPEGFEAEREVLISRVETYTGMSAEEFEQLVRFQAETAAVREAVGTELEVEPEDTVRSRHIHVADLETAEEVIERLNDGENFEDLVSEFTLDTSLVFGNRGEIGAIQEGMTVPEFEEAAFNAEIGEVVGPIESQFGFHIIEVLDQTTAEEVCARHILLETEEEANAAVRLLGDGRDFGELAAEYSLDTQSGMRGGDLGCFGEGMMVPPFEEAAFGAEVGEIVGPVESDFGWHVIEVMDHRDAVSSAEVRHILVETEEEAQQVLERLEAGEDFGDLAQELSTDPSAQPLGSDTLTLFTRGQQSGLYGLSDLRTPEFDVVFDAEVGDIVGPIETSDGVYVVEVQEVGSREPASAASMRQNYVVNWESELVESDLVQQTNLWRPQVPLDPMPGDVYDMLAVLDDHFIQIHEEYLESYEANLIPNVLRTLELPIGDSGSDN